MEKYNLPGDIKVFGMQVKTFPEGIGEAFETLVNIISNGYDRSYYGISYMTKEGVIIYIAAAEEKYEGEAEKYHCERYIIERGEYLTVRIRDWRRKTDCIKDVFHEMMQDSRIEKTSTCLEWYKDDDEMLCMIKINQKHQQADKQAN